MNKAPKLYPCHPDSIQDWANVERLTVIVTKLEEARDSNAELAKLPHNSGVRYQLMSEAENLYIESRCLDSFLGIKRTCRNCSYKATAEVKGE